MMTRQFDPAKAGGFLGAIVYDLGLSDGTRRPWAIEIHDGRRGRTSTPPRTRRSR